MIPYFPLTGTKAKPRICIATTAISLTDLQHQCKSVLPETEALLELRYDFFLSCRLSISSIANLTYRP